MIHVARPKNPPPVLTSTRAERAFRQLERFYRTSPERRRQRRAPFDRAIYRHPEVGTALWTMFHGKCAYCESKAADGVLDVDHHRPRARALNLDGTAAPDHYWWLTYEWKNLLPVCPQCSRSKGSRFPVQGERADFGTRLTREGALLIDPTVGRAERHLVFSEDGRVSSETDRGRTTIEILSLNRGPLVDARQSVGRQLDALFQNAEAVIMRHAQAGRPEVQEKVGANFDLIRSMLDARQEYAAMRRQLIHSWLDAMGIAESDLEALARPLVREASKMSDLVTEEERRSVAEGFEEHSARQQAYSVEAEAPSAVETYYSGAKRIEWIEIRNFKAIQHLKLSFPEARADDESSEKEESWLTLLGVNGMGKSSVLQAVALALMGEAHCRSLDLDASGFVRRKAREPGGWVRVKLTNVPDPVGVEFTRKSKLFHYETKDPKLLLHGYGATRLLRRLDGADGGPPFIQIRNLFDPTAPLDDVQRWLLDRNHVDDERFDAIALALKSLLMLDDDDRFIRRRGAVEAILRDTSVPLSQLSDGFQSVIALCGDLIMSLLQRWPSVQDAEAIVLLDEIEAHLHPTWKIEIVQRLRRTFPRVTFLVTTHDPLCLKGLAEGEIALLERDERGRIVANTDVPSVQDLRADQILTSYLFGLHSTRGDEAQNKIERYAELFSKRRRTPAEQQELEEIRAALEETLSAHETPSQRVIERAVQQTLEASAPAPRPRKKRSSHLPTPDELEARRQVDKLLNPS